MTVERLLTDYQTTKDKTTLLRELLSDYRSIDDLIDQKEFTTLNFLTHIYYLSLEELTSYIGATSKEDFLSIYKFILDSDYINRLSDTELDLIIDLIITTIKYGLVDEMKEILRKSYSGISKDTLIEEVSLLQLPEKVDLTDKMKIYLSELGLKITISNQKTKRSSMSYLRKLLQEKRYSELKGCKKEDIYNISIEIDDITLIDSPQSFFDYIVEKKYLTLSGNVINYLISSGVIDMNRIILWAEMSGESHKLLLILKRIDTLYNGDLY